jgi:hypothetical protein
MNMNVNHKLNALPPAQNGQQPVDAGMATKRGPVMVLRAGALDYRRYPSLAGSERLAYKSGAHLGDE